MDRIIKLGRQLVKEGPFKMERSPRRVRVLHRQKYIFDTLEASYVWEHPRYPQYYLPFSQLKNGTHETNYEDPTGFQVVSLLLEKDRVQGCLKFDKGPCEGLLRVPFGDVDAWFEEDQQIYVHPKDPYKRVDVLPSTRKLTVMLQGPDGQSHKLAESSSVYCLFETTLPTRYYLPMTSVDWQFLKPTDTVTGCPYKGEANYYDVEIGGSIHRNLVWYYRNPTPECIMITGRACFYNEKVDIYIDGQKQDRPVTHFG